jgi:signal transduction histidine kinase
MDDYYKNERRLLDEAQALSLRGEATPKDYENLTRAYERLLRQSEKLIRLGDANQNKLMRAQRMLERGMQFHRRTAEEAKKTATAKSEMLGILTHDLKNRVGPFVPLVEMLLEEIPEPDEKIREILDLMLAASQRMANAIDLTLNREASSGSQDVIPIFEWIDITKLIQECVRDNSPAASRKGIQMAYEGPDFYEAKVDAFLLGEVFDNLISNGIKYSPPAKPLKIRLELIMGGKRFRFAVQDEGLGLSVEDHDLLFERFKTASAKPTGDEKASGLGLSIVKRFTEIHHGKVSAESPGRDQGSTFAVDLPKNATEPA